MNRFFFAILCFFVALTLPAQHEVKVVRQQSLRRYGIAAGNYSGITHIGGNRYAVCDDKSPDGFYIWKIDIDNTTGKIRNVQNEGFHASGAANRDAEDIAYNPETQTVYMVSEADGRIYSYHLDGTPNSSVSPTLLYHFSKNTGLEGLTYDSHRQCLWAMEENNGRGECRLVCVDVQFTTPTILTYTLDPSTAKKKGMVHAHGVSAVCALDDGRLLVLEREAYVPRKKVGAWMVCRLYAVFPDKLSEKQLVAQWRTRLNLTARSWANFEGLCVGPRLTDGSRVLLLVSDSQNGYGGVLRDRIRTILLRP